MDLSRNVETACSLRPTSGALHGRQSDPGRSSRRLSGDHAQPAATPQCLQRGDAPRVARRARRGGDRSRLPRAVVDGRRPRFLRRPGSCRPAGQAGRDGSAGRRAGELLQPTCSQAARIAVSGRGRGERRGGRRRRQHGARLRHRAGGAVGELRAGLRQDRAGSGFRRQLFSAAPGRDGARPRPCASGRAVAGRQGGRAGV